MTSSEIKTCAICLGSVETGQGQAIFTAECSHSFHFTCITKNVTHGNHLCPVCRAKWHNLPFLVPKVNTDNTNQDPFHFRQNPSDHEPVRFSDDEPLPTVEDTSTTALQNVTIKSIPECQAVTASEPVPRFAVLVGVRAPPLSQTDQRAPVDLVTVLDVSGSMRGSKLALLKRAVHFVVDNLGSSDRLSIVSFSTVAQRIFPLRRMTDHGREDAKRAVDSLLAHGVTNIEEGLKTGVQVLEERRHRNPVASIIFLSDGRDTCHGGRGFQFPTIFPVHAFGFGADHDPIIMHSIADSSSGGTFSFIESYEMVQDAFASCIGGLLSVVTQELRLTLMSASNGVEIKSIPSGRYASEISDGGSRGLVSIGDLYADEEKEFLITLLVPALTNNEAEGEKKTPLLDITCSYKDIVSNETVHLQCNPVEILRPTDPTSSIMNLEVDRQRNRLNAAEGIAEAQRMAETGDLSGARDILSNGRSMILSSASGQAGDELSMWLEAEMKETEERMGNRGMYDSAGRAYALSNMSAHASQRGVSFFGRARGSSASFSAYATPQMANMVNRSQQSTIADDAAATPKED